MSELPLDNHPENINRFERFSELVGIQIEDPDARVNAITNTDADTFLDGLSVANGLLQGKDRFQRWQGESANAQVKSLLLGTDIEPPENSHELFKEFYKRFQDELEPTPEGLQKSAVEMYFAIIGSHLFDDGNGRLARAAYYLIKDGALPEQQSDILERSDEIVHAATAVNSGTIGVLLEREGIEYEFVNEFAADENQSDEDGIFVDGGFTQQLKYIAARRVMLQNNTWPTTPPATVALKNWPDSRKAEFHNEYADVRQDWLNEFINYSGNYAPALSELIEHKQVEEPLARTVMLMERFRAEDIFKTPERSKAFLDSLDFNDFKRWLSFVNGMERDIPRTERGFREGSVVESESSLLGNEIEYQPPHQKQREMLMEMAFNKAKSLEDPELAGLTLGFAINAIHPYPDGNGRTARIVTALLSRGYDGSDEAKRYYSNLLENQKGREVINPNPAVHNVDRKIANDLREVVSEKSGYTDISKMPRYVSNGYGDAMAGELTSQDLVVAENISDTARRNLDLVLRDGQFTPLAIMKAFPSKRIEQYLKTTKSANAYIDGDEFVESLSEDEITDLAKASIVVKASYVKRLIEFSDRADVDEIVNSYR